MDAEHLVVHHGTETEVIKDVCAQLPHVRGAILPDALVVKTVHLGNLPALVITSD